MDTEINNSSVFEDRNVNHDVLQLEHLDIINMRTAPPALTFRRRQSMDQLRLYLANGRCDPPPWDGQDVVNSTTTSNPPQNCFVPPGMPNDDELSRFDFLDSRRPPPDLPPLNLRGMHELRNWLSNSRRGPVPQNLLQLDDSSGDISSDDGVSQDGSAWRDKVEWKEKVDGVFGVGTDLRMCQFDGIQFPCAFNKPLKAKGSSIKHYKGLKDYMRGFTHQVEVPLFVINGFNVKVLVLHQRPDGLLYKPVLQAVQKGLEKSIESLPPHSETKLNYDSHIDKWINVWNLNDWNLLGPEWQKNILNCVKEEFLPQIEEDVGTETQATAAAFQEKFDVQFIIYKSGQSLKLEDFNASQLRFLNPGYVNVFFLHFALDASLKDHHMMFKPQVIHTDLRDSQRIDWILYRPGLIPGIGNITYEYQNSRLMPCHFISYYGKILSQEHRDLQTILSNQIISRRSAQIYGSHFEQKKKKCRFNERDRKMESGQVTQVLNRLANVAKYDTSARVEVVVSCKPRESMEEILQLCYRRARKILYNIKDIKNNMQIYQPVSTVDYSRRLQSVWPYIIGTYEYCLERVFSFKSRAKAGETPFDIPEDRYLTLEDLTAVLGCDLILQGWLRGDLKRDFPAEWREFLGIQNGDLAVWNPRVFSSSHPPYFFRNLERVEEPVKRFTIPHIEPSLIKSFSKVIFSKFPNATKQVLKEVDELKKLRQQAGSLSKFRRMELSSYLARLMDSIVSLILTQTLIGTEYYPRVVNLVTVAGAPEWRNCEFRLLTSKDFVYELFHPRIQTFDAHWNFLRELLKFIKSLNLINLENLIAQAISHATISFSSPCVIWAKPGHGVAILPDFDESFDKQLFTNLWKNTLVASYDIFKLEKKFLTFMSRFYKACSMVPDRLMGNLTIDRLIPFFDAVLNGGTFSFGAQYWGHRFVSFMKNEDLHETEENEHTRSSGGDSDDDNDEIPNDHTSNNFSHQVTNRILITVPPSTNGSAVRHPRTGNFINSNKNTQTRARDTTGRLITATTSSHQLNTEDILGLAAASPIMPPLDPHYMIKLRQWLKFGRPGAVPYQLKAHRTSPEQPQESNENRTSREARELPPILIDMQPDPISLELNIQDIQRFGGVPSTSSLLDQQVMQDLRAWLKSQRMGLIPIQFRNCSNTSDEPLSRVGTISPDTPAGLNYEAGSVPPEADQPGVNNLGDEVEIGAVGSINSLAEVIQKVKNWQKENDVVADPVKIHWRAPSGKIYELRRRNRPGVVETAAPAKLLDGVTGRRRRWQKRPVQAEAAPSFAAASYPGPSVNQSPEILVPPSPPPVSATPTVTMADQRQVGDREVTANRPKKKQPPPPQVQQEMLQKMAQDRMPQEILTFESSEEALAYALQQSCITAQRDKQRQNQNSSDSD